MMNLLEENLSDNLMFQPVLTKIDKIPKMQLDALLYGIAHQCTLSGYKKLYPLVLGTSSKLMVGIDELRFQMYFDLQKFQ